jgi:hypothetical protein
MGVTKMTQFLPPMEQEADKITLLYSLEKDGASIHTLYAKSGSGPCLMAVKDTQGKVFGVFSNVPFHVNAHYYGNGSWFLKI